MAKRCNLLADFEHHDGAVHRTYSAGVRTLPEAAFADAQARGLIGPAPKAAQAKAPARKKPAAKKA